MKTFAIVLVIGFALQVSNALMPSDLETVVETCLVENEFTSSKDDVALVDYIGKPEGVDKLKDVPREKLAAVLACMYHKQYKKTTLYDMLKYLTEMDDKVTKDQYQQMKETLTTCVQQAQGNDVELLKCVKAVDPPFDYLIATLRDLGEEPLNFCYERCGLKIPDLYTLEIYEKNIDVLMQRIPQDKLACAVACKVYREDNPRQITYNILTKAIEIAGLSDDTKTEMRGTLENCHTEGYKKEEMASTLEKSINEADLKRIYAIGDPKQADKLKDVSKEKMVNVVACLYDKLYPHQKLYPSIRQLIDRGK
ncbi:hypothetical protein TSAR_011150 [Trichomalopsis sarcophagae]|uniref:Uncharacterized protein n=1 Tax=Trichomalopsis sarcophagae TaxID=543379 RepID=A0A232FHZ3_9HYME|nr:hypothetical protein TSAR_011150 [Trichomalopsis sarcophagae]